MTTDTRTPTITHHGKVPFVPFLNLPPRAQKEARRRFSPAGRSMGWENIENWAFPLKKDGTLAATRLIEPLYTRTSD
jgi:hypothetical protein